MIASLNFTQVLFASVCVFFLLLICIVVLRNESAQLTIRRYARAKLRFLIGIGMAVVITVIAGRIANVCANWNGVKNFSSLLNFLRGLDGEGRDASMMMFYAPFFVVSLLLAEWPLRIFDRALLSRLTRRRIASREEEQLTGADMDFGDFTSSLSRALSAKKDSSSKQTSRRWRTLFKRY